MTRTTKQVDRLSHVLELTELNFRLHPLEPKLKRPIVSGWPLLATNDQQIIQRWYRVDPERNWGIACGRGLLVIDIDVKKGDGERSWHDFLGGKKLPKTVEATTPSKGRHLYYAYDDKITIGNSAGSLAKFVDVRADGGFVACVPSVTDEGSYTWVDGKSPFELEIAAIPKWLLKKIQEATPDTEFEPIGGNLENGNRNNTIYHWALSLAKNGTNFDFALYVIQKWLEDQNADDMNNDEIIATVKSAYKKSANIPGPQDLHYTDVGNAQRFVRKYGADTRYVPQWGRWIIWNGSKWDLDVRNVIREYARLAVLDIHEEAEKAKSNKIKALISTHAFRSESTSKISAMLTEAQSFPSQVAEPIELDSVWSKLNLLNGTFDLETMKINPHSHSDLITKLIRINYNEDAKCEQFTTWLIDMLSTDEQGNAFPDSDVQSLVDYLQMAIGRMLFGGNPEKEAFFCYGPTNTGKTTLTALIERIAGDYAKRFNIELLLSQKMKRNANDATPELANLAGARIAIGTEMPAGRHLNEALFKDLTGSKDRITARFLHQDPFDFIPQFTIWMYGNDRPGIRAEDEASFGRMRMLPMKTQVAAGKINPNLLTEKFEPEIEGILKWMLDGAIRAHHEFKNNIPVPSTITKELDAYKTEVDVVKQFIEEYVVPAKGAETKMRSLYDLFTQYMHIVHNSKWIPVNARTFGQRLPKLLGGLKW